MHTDSSEANSAHRPALATLSLGALGVVFGDIGTSPLYALRECFHGPHKIAVSAAHVFGVLSLVFWSLLLIITIKYLLLILRADNKGEGGILALMALVSARKHFKNLKVRSLVIGLGIIGAALLYGDGMITPAISVLSAIEGLQFAAPALQPFVIPLTLVVLVALFTVQHFGTARIGSAFGPVMLLWFGVLALLGLRQIMAYPQILNALMPGYALQLLLEHGWHAFGILGAVFLVVTGGEALYADMGHFGRTPIRITWLVFVLPALMLNYLGQGALIMMHPENVFNPFYQLAPGWLQIPLILLATAATVIASQALISGVFSLTRQAIQLGYSPRMAIIHTSPDTIGQIYVPFINWALCVGTIGLVMFFRTSSAMAAAYGVAVSLTMLVTTLLTGVAARKLWHWNMPTVVLIISVFVLIDGMFFTANALKFIHGGWLALLIGLGVYICMSTWMDGRRLLAQRLRLKRISVQRFIGDMLKMPHTMVSGTAIYMTADPESMPQALYYNVKHNKVLHKNIIILSMVIEDMPRVAADDHIQISPLVEGMTRVVAYFGFMDDPNVIDVLISCEDKGLKLELGEITFFMGRESVQATNRPGMALWREKLFVFMARNAQNPTEYFRIPFDRAVEVGIQVDI